MVAVPARAQPRTIGRLAVSRWAVLVAVTGVAGLVFRIWVYRSILGTPSSDEANPAPYTVFSNGGAGAVIGPAWYSCCTGAKYKGVTQQFVMPSHTKGQPMPGFLGGSDLAVPAPSGNKALAADWIKDFTSTDAERSLQSKGNIPNATSLLGSSVNERAAARSWFVPAAKHWVDVENGNILRNMLAQILRGKLSVAQAASSASDNITSVLNGA